jgi:hypothetical protein
MNKSYSTLRKTPPQGRRRKRRRKRRRRSQANMLLFLRWPSLQ